MDHPNSTPDLRLWPDDALKRLTIALLRPHDTSPGKEIQEELNLFFVEAHRGKLSFEICTAMAADAQSAHNALLALYGLLNTTHCLVPSTLQTLVALQKEASQNTRTLLHRLQKLRATPRHKSPGLSPEQLSNAQSAPLENLLHAGRYALASALLPRIIHELSSPMTYISSSTCLIAMALREIHNPNIPDSWPASRRDLLESCEDALEGTQRLQRILEEFSQLQDEQPRATSLQSLLTTALRLSEADRQPHKLHNAEELRFEGAPGDFLLAAVNLLHGAVRSLEHSSVRSPVEIQCNRLSSEIYISFFHEGLKLPHSDEDSLNLFDPPSKDAPGLSGLGLSLSRAILERNHSDLSVHTEPEKTTYLIRIPPATDC